MSEQKKPGSGNKGVGKKPGTTGQKRPPPPPPEDPDPRLMTFLERDAKPHEQTFSSQRKGFLRRLLG